MLFADVLSLVTQPKATEYMQLFQQMEPPYTQFDPALLGAEFPAELATVSRLWFTCGYRPGIGAYLNFFLLKDFIIKHDTSHPPRFQSFKSMANSFYQTDLFIRDVTDSGQKPTGGISSERVRNLLQSIMRRHERFTIPHWMMTHFGFSLMENVERECGGLTPEEQRLHLAYMSKVFRLMGIPFSTDRQLLEQFARAVEAAHAGLSPNIERHAKNILLLGEMVGVSSSYQVISAMLPEPTRVLFHDLHPQVRPNALARVWAKIFGSLLMKQAVGVPRQAVPVAG